MDMKSLYLLVPMAPLVGAAIGWVTNFLAVKMLFRPRRPVRILGLTVQGLVPKRRRELAASIADTNQTHLVTGEELRAALSDPGFLASLRTAAGENA